MIWWYLFSCMMISSSTNNLVVGFSILHNTQEQLTNNPDNAFDGSRHSLVRLGGCRSLVVNWPAIASIACVTTYNRFLHLIGANDQGHMVGARLRGFSSMESECCFYVSSLAQKFSRINFRIKSRF